MQILSLGGCEGRLLARASIKSMQSMGDLNGLGQRHSFAHWANCEFLFEVLFLSYF
jgi:hypothetical protein